MRAEAATNGALRRTRPRGTSEPPSPRTDMTSVYTEAVEVAQGQTRDRLLDEAMRLFGERGFAATSVAEIERSAGLTPGAGGLFHHFRTKEDVLTAGIERQLARLDAIRQIRGAIPPLNNLRAELTLVARYVLAEIDEEQELLLVLVTEGRRRPDLLSTAVDQIIQGSFAEFSSVIARYGGSETVAALALSALVGVASSTVLLGRPFIDTAHEDVVATWVDMVAATVGG